MNQEVIGSLMEFSLSIIYVVILKFDSILTNEQISIVDESSLATLIDKIFVEENLNDI
jgi:hypothetical protein